MRKGDAHLGGGGGQRISKLAFARCRRVDKGRLGVRAHRLAQTSYLK